MAAVLIALLAARGVFVLVHDQGGPKLRVLEAYRAGDIDGALQRAKTECRGDECAGLEAKLAKAASLSSRIGALTPEERAELGALDEALAPGGTSAIALKLRAPAPPPVSPRDLDGLVDEARELIQSKSYDAAVARLEQCVRLDPGHAACLRMLGSTYARIASRDGDAEKMERARTAYQRFLEVAPPDDVHVPKVRQILEAAPDEAPAPSDSPTPFVDWDTTGAGGQRSGDGSVVVVVGGTGVVETSENIRRVAIGDGSVADVSVTGPRKLTVTGVAEGETTLLVWLSSGARRVWLVQVHPK
ncbi:MAG: pilus assembly protein N-terminal domain-containing protein [Myxococcota bacterium]